MKKLYLHIEDARTYTTWRDKQSVVEIAVRMLHDGEAGNDVKQQ